MRYRVWAELTSGVRVQVGFLPSRDDADQEMAALIKRVGDGERWAELDGTWADLGAVVAIGVTAEEGYPELTPTSSPVQRWAVSTPSS